MRKIIAGLCLLLFLCTPINGLLAEDNKQPSRNIPPTRDEMASMFGDTTKAMMKSKLSVLSEEETVELLAKFTKNYYDALINVGFSEDQAFQIVLSVGVPPVY